MSRQDERKFTVRLFGPFSIRASDGDDLDIGGKKNRALFALLSTAPDGLRTRAQLSKMLWASSGTGDDRTSLRKALSDMRQRMGLAFSKLIATDNHEVRLNLNAIEILGTKRDGEFLEGLDIPEPAFRDWRRDFAAAQPDLPSATSEPEYPLLLDSPLRAPMAVLPFASLSDRADGWIIGDLVAEEISRALSRSNMLDVVSHLSCRDEAVQACSLPALKDKLGAEFVVSGRLRGSGDQLVLDVDFADTESQRNHWTRRYKIGRSDLLNNGSTAVDSLVREIGRTILDCSIEVSASRPLPTVESHALLISAVALMHRQTLQSFSSARPQLEEIVRRAPGQAIPQAWLSKWYILSIQQGWSVDIAKDAALAQDWTRRALDLDPDCSFSLAIDGFVQNNLQKRFDQAADRFDHAIDMDCNNALAWLLKGTLNAFQDNGRYAVAYTSRARSLSPLDPHRYFFDSLSATAYLANRDYDTALDLADRSLRMNRRHTSTLRVKTIALHQLGRGDEARAAAAQLRSLDPGLTVEGYLKNHPAAEFRTGREWSAALRDSGIPLN